MRYPLIFAFLFTFVSLSGQYKKEDHPKLIVALTVDQMRYDYISRFWEKYSDDGFKRLIEHGFFYENAHYGYGPTYTGPGHASIFTGCTPSVHGIIGNNWYDKYGKQNIYCAQDTSVQTVGAQGTAGKMSPKNMLASTLSDQIKLATNFKSKSIGISLKDRGAILPAGHSADGAYWFDAGSGNWITSSFYMEQLPYWVSQFNLEGHTEKWLNGSWAPLLPIEEYTESIVDNNPFEKPFIPGDLPVFPYDLKKISSKGGLGTIRATPFGNTISKNLAKRAIIGENLGKDQITDFLSLSFSSTDYVGHQFGPRSIELEDTYLRLDLDIADLLNFLDAEIGQDNYLVMLTADHGAVEIPLYLQNNNIPAGYFSIEQYKNGLYDYINELFGKEKWVVNISNNQVFIDHDLVSEKDLKSSDILDAIKKYSLDFEGIAFCLTKDDLISGSFEGHHLKKLQKGIHQKRSGDVVLLMEPAWITYMRQGTTHGSTYSYDTHIPIIFYGKNIKVGTSFNLMNITDISPSLSAMLHIQAPNGSTGEIHREMIQE